RLIPLANPENPAQQHYRKQRDELLEKERSGQLTERDRVNLSACLIRLGQAEEAVRVLTPAARSDCRNFMILANLATATELAAAMDPSRLTRSSDTLEQALSERMGVWPKEWDGLNKEQLAWYRRAEEFHRHLLRLRSREAFRQQRGTVSTPTTVDALFGP